MRIRAFTYLELLFVIVLSSLVFASGFYAVRIFSAQGYWTQQKKDKLHDLSYFDLVLRKAFFTAHDSELKDNVIHFVDAEKSHTFLQIEEQRLVFSGAHSDTLYCLVKDFSWRDVQDKISLQIAIEMDGQDFPIHLMKNEH
ncbi:MAG: type II secretion system protein [Bacteroidota bacterium]